MTGGTGHDTPAAAVEEPRPPRSIVIVDTETTGLDSERHWAWEIAWVHVGYASGLFYPVHSLAEAEDAALAIGGYHARVPAPDSDRIDRSLRSTSKLHAALRGNTLCGANPAFDARFLSKLFRFAGLDPEPWHHRLLDVSAFGAGVLGLDPTELPGLARLADLLGLEVPAHYAHTAEGDVDTTYRVLARLLEIVAERAA